MQKGPASGRSPMFVPRLTLVLLSGFALFMLLALLYSLPVLLDAPPPGAGPDYVAERVRAHLEGKAISIMAGSFLIVALASARWMRR